MDTDNKICPNCNFAKQKYVEELSAFKHFCKRETEHAHYVSAKGTCKYWQEKRVQNE
jgi:hypothetical protein